MKTKSPENMSKNVYMINRDGKIFDGLNCLTRYSNGFVIHPYLYEDIFCDLINYGEDAVTKEDLEVFCSTLEWIAENSSIQNVIDKSVCAIKSICKLKIIPDYYNYFSKHYETNNDIIVCENKKELLTILYELRYNLNQEFLRIRVGGEYYSNNSSKNLYIRISSTGFNWFNIIWMFVYDRRNQFDKIFVETDEDSKGECKAYSHNGVELYNIDINDFIELGGSPIIEKINKTSLFDKMLEINMDDIFLLFEEYSPYEIIKIIDKKNRSELSELNM